MKTNPRYLSGVVGLGLLVGAGSSHAVLVAHYRFDEVGADLTNALDSAGGDQNATKNQGGAISSTAGQIGGAYDLPGNASLQAADAIGAGASAFTISVWVNMDDTPGYDGIYQTRNENWGINVEGGSAGALHYDYRFDNDPGGGSTGIDSAGGSAVVGTWQHVAMTWSASGNYIAYLNGVESVRTASINVATVYTAGSQLWNICDDPCCNGRELNAQIDDLAVWDEELSATQILQIYNGGLAGLDAPTSLVPEPGTATLALFGGLLVLRRRRRR